MKNIFYFIYFSLILIVSAKAQSKNDQFLINQKLDSKFKNEIVFVKLINDSRCPEKTQCVWAGEVSFEVAAYRNKKLVEKKQFTLNNSTEEEVKKWFTLHSPIRKNPIKYVAVYPYPKNGMNTKQEDYFIQLIY
ncbi:MAG: hypothetical protein QM535_16315 [Limnohabitans sp.]|nr:hypothetical protein [Limnohabitans sp.]